MLAVSKTRAAFQTEKPFMQRTLWRLNAEGTAMSAAGASQQNAFNLILKSFESQLPTSVLQCCVGLKRRLNTFWVRAQVWHTACCAVGLEQGPWHFGSVSTGIVEVTS